MTLQAANQARLLAFKIQTDDVVHGERQMEPRNDPKLPQASIGHLSSGTNMRTVQGFSCQQICRILQTPSYIWPSCKQAWAQEHNVELSHPTNSSILA
jgi:hypothetical protein